MIAVKKVGQQSVDGAMAALLKEVRFTPDKGKGIFIKPNVVIGTGDSSIITSLELVESLLRCFFGYKLIIGERSAVGIDTYKALERSGYVELAHTYGVEIVDLSKSSKSKSGVGEGYLGTPEGTV